MKITNGISWTEAVYKALEKKGGPASPYDLYPHVRKLIKNDFDELRFRHAIRSALYSLEKMGMIEHIGFKEWIIKDH